MDKVWTLIKLLYSSILRAELIKLIDNPDSQIDDFFIGVLDRIFEYDGGGN